MQEQFDLVVVGGGPAGYVAAIRAAQLGLKVAAIEKDATWGGTCLNVGCIPSKALLESSEHFVQAKTQFASHGIQLPQVQLDLAQMMKRKSEVVKQLVTGVSFLLKKNKVTALRGKASLLSASAQGQVLEVLAEDGAVSQVQAKKVLLATGSVPVELPFLPFDEKRVFSSTGALSLSQVPEHLVIIGGGVIGVELGSVWSRLGAKVTVVEYQERICAGVDGQLAAELMKLLKKQGLNFLLNTRCLGAKWGDGGNDGQQPCQVQLEDRLTQQVSELACSHVLVATGRKPYSEGLGLEKVGLQTNAAGRLEVDGHFQTAVPGIFAVGDLIAGPMLAHKAEKEGIAAVECMVGQAGHVNYPAIPNVIYTWPEVASCGWTEEELKGKGVAYKVGQFSFNANGRAKVIQSTEGFVKILADPKTDRLLGMHIVGPWASDLIAEGVLVMEYGGSADDLARTTHAHPTLSEVVKEAAMAVNQRQIHS